ncbi:hypothetical protein R6258_04285 [Halomonas sp. HP20-15]|uniref:hypothetical protein n=1 Tax=Halomonas sp. HP20-15 TaxID=3085901 RepID=UPI002981D986|nr:hypothetical protein [Halomonas sp. HP20-15]MDW5376132.1 hypothetical protein [Halomonas sp. HP20-15]
MFKVTLELRCNVCSGERFMLPSLDETDQTIRCAECRAFKCHGDDLERILAGDSGLPRHAQRSASWQLAAR